MKTAKTAFPHFLPTSQNPAVSSSVADHAADHAACGVCGSHDIVVDEVVSAGSRLGLGECQHCEYRWTSPLAIEPVRELRPHLDRPLAA